METYSFLHHTLHVAGMPISGFASGDDVLSVAYRNDGIEDETGADGEMMAIISADKSASIKVKLLYTSLSNDWLEKQYSLFLQGRIRTIPVSLFNTRTGKGEVATNGYIKKIPDKTLGKKAGSMEWEIVVPKLAVQKPTLNINIGINL